MNSISLEDYLIGIDTFSQVTAFFTYCHED